LLRLNNERFSIPELLFHPSDVGIDEKGISEAIISVIRAFPENMHPHFYKSIILTGGNANLPGFYDRIASDVRRDATIFNPVTIHCDPEYGIK